MPVDAASFPPDRPSSSSGYRSKIGLETSSSRHQMMAIAPSANSVRPGAALSSQSLHADLYLAKSSSSTTFANHYNPASQTNLGKSPYALGSEPVSGVLNYHLPRRRDPVQLASLQRHASPPRYASSVSTSSLSSESIKSKGKGRKSTGRGGSGNIIKPGKLKVGTVDEAEVIRQRRLQAQLSPRARIITSGRGGTGNIKNATEAIPFDYSKDPDDMYERIVQMENKRKKEAQPPLTGRGGLGNAGGGRVATKLSKKGKEKLNISVSASAPNSPWTPSSSMISDNFEMRIFSPVPSEISTAYTSVYSSNGSLSDFPATPSSHYSDCQANFAPLPLPHPVLLQRSRDDASILTSRTTSNSSKSVKDSASTTNSAEGHDLSEPENKTKWWKISKRNKNKNKGDGAAAALQGEGTSLPVAGRLGPHADNDTIPNRGRYPGDVFEFPSHPYGDATLNELVEVDVSESKVLDTPQAPPMRPSIYSPAFQDLHQRLRYLADTKPAHSIREMPVHVDSSPVSGTPSRLTSPASSSSHTRLPQQSHHGHIVDSYLEGMGLDDLEPKLDLWTLKEEDEHSSRKSADLMSDQCSLESSFFEF